LKYIALLSLNSESPTTLTDYTALRLGKFLSRQASVVWVSVSDFCLSGDRARILRGLQIEGDRLAECFFPVPIEPAYVFFVHHSIPREYSRCLDLLTQLGERGIKTNYDPDAGSLGVKSVLEERCREYETASGRTVPRPQTITIRSEQENSSIIEFMKTAGPCILKPHNSSRSRGISILANEQEVEQLALGKNLYVVQELLPEPFLIDGYKTGLRVYLMIHDLKRSYSLSEQGLVKLPARPYVRADPEAEIVGPHMKRDGNWPAIYLLKDLVNSEHTEGEWKPIRKSIEKTIDLLMEAVSWRAGMFHRRPPTAQIWGVDLLIQRNGAEFKAYLIEVNTFPALYREDDVTDGILDEVVAAELFAKALEG
jgi:hypothetical protein